MSKTTILLDQLPIPFWSLSRDELPGARSNVVPAASAAHWEEIFHEFFEAQAEIGRNFPQFGSPTEYQRPAASAPTAPMVRLYHHQREERFWFINMPYPQPETYTLEVDVATAERWTKAIANFTDAQTRLKFNELMKDVVADNARQEPLICRW